MTETSEYEVITDANIIGQITYPPYFIRPWDIGDYRPGEKRLLCLRITRDEPLLQFPDNKANEFIYLASLFLRKRLTLGPITRLNNEPTRIYFGLKLSQGYVDIDVVCGETDRIGGYANLSDLSEWLPLVDKIDKTLRDRFILAVRFYHQAIQMIEDETDMAYINLISAIEVLCQDLDIGKRNLGEIDQGLADAVNKIEQHNIKSDIEKRILSKERFIQRKFIKFVQDNIEESFWKYNKRPDLGRIEPTDLPRILKNVYQQRSNFLHNGEPFPDYIYIRESIPNLFHLKYGQSVTIGKFHREEIPVGNAIMSGGRTWLPQQYIPYPHFFERLVRHVLINYLKRYQESKDSQ